jgi:hypothetical protein
MKGYGLSENAQCERTIWLSRIGLSVYPWLVSYATGSPRQTGRTLLSRFSGHLDDERLANHREKSTDEFVRRNLLDVFKQNCACNKLFEEMGIG